MPDIEFTCPKCGGNGWREQSFPKPAILLWLANPFSAISELILGQRLPRVTYICIRCDLPLYQRLYLRCSGCGTFHSSMLWGRSNAFGHWFGLFCPDCGGRIPLLLSAASLAMAGVTSCLWYPVWLCVRRRWIAWERQRAAAQRSGGALGRPLTKRWGLWGALTFGPVMWLLTAFPQFWFGAERGDVLLLIVKLLFWVVMGLLFGWGMKLVLDRRHKFKAGHCRACGYNLLGLPANVCPECGFRFDPADKTEAGPPP